MVSRDDAWSLFERRRDAWLSEDVDAYLSCFTEDAVLELPARSPVRGRRAYAELVRPSLERLRPMGFDFHAMAVDSGIVMAEWTITLAVRSDGRMIAYRGMSACRMEQGLITHWREYYDPALLRPS